MPHGGSDHRSFDVCYAPQSAARADIAKGRSGATSRHAVIAVTV